MLRVLCKHVKMPSAVRSASRAFCSEVTDEQSQTPGQQRSEKSVNQVNLLGRVGQDAEYRGSESHPVVLFSMATNVSYTRQDGELYSRTDWHRISVFRPFIRDKVAANLRKGDRVYVSGQIQYDEYRDRNDAQQRSTSIIASDIVNLTRKFLNEKDDM